MTNGLILTSSLNPNKDKDGEKMSNKLSDLWYDNAGELIDIIAIVLSIALIVSILCLLLRRTKFCPECGKLYRSNFEYCQYDGTELKTRGDT